jgi:hypothetical protein
LEQVAKPDKDNKQQRLLIAKEMGNAMMELRDIRELK